MRRLVIRPGGIGDFIVSLPALESLRSEYLEVWTAARNTSLVRFADKTRSIASTGLDLLELGAAPPILIKELLSFDSIVSWYGSGRQEFRDAVERLNLPFTFLPALPPEGSAVHATDFYLQQVRTITDCRVDAIPLIPCATERGNFAVIHPFSGSPRKNWPLERFEAIARGLERHMIVKWCAGEDDPPLPGLNPVRIADLYELGCWLSKARLYVGNDSGISHLAAAVGTPVLVLFGPTNPDVWAPRGAHVRIALWNV